MAAIDARGRIADRTIPTVLGWSPGARLTFQTFPDHIVVHASPDGDGVVSLDGHVKLPAPIRRRLGVQPGDRVLLVAEREGGTLSAYPPAALDAMLTQYTPHPVAGRS